MPSTVVNFALTFAFIMVPQDVPAKKVLSSSRAWEALTPELSQWILDAVSSMGFDRMTPVQASCIPLFIGNKDVVVEVGNLHFYT